MSALENLPVALNHISKQNGLCSISFLPDPFLFITFISSSALRSAATGFSVFSGSAHKTSLPCSHTSTTTKPTSAKNPGRIKILPAPTKHIQVILFMNSKLPANNAVMITICSLSTNSWLQLLWFQLKAKSTCCVVASAQSFKIWLAVTLQRYFQYNSLQISAVKR